MIDEVVWTSIESAIDNTTYVHSHHITIRARHLSQPTITKVILSDLSSKGENDHLFLVVDDVNVL